MTAEPQGVPTPGTAEVERSLSPEIAYTVGGMFLWGISAYAVYAVSARLLSADEFASYALWWTTINVLAVGLFSSFESAGPHLLTKLRLTSGEDGPAARWLASAGLKALGVACVVMAAVSIAVQTSSGVSWLALIPLGLMNLGVAASASVQRGIAVGRRRYPALFLQLACTGVSQTAMLLALLAAGASNVMWIAAVTALGPAIGVSAAALRGIVPGRTGSGEISQAERSGAWRAIASLSVAALASQVMHNAVLPAGRRAGLDSTSIGGLVGTLTIGRVPLMLLNPIGAPLIPRATYAVQAGDRPRLVRMITAVYIGSLTLAVSGAVVLAVIGPTLLHLYLGPEYSVPRWILASAGFATGLFLLASLSRLLLVSLERTAGVAAAWIAALATLGVVLALPIDPWLRVGLATPCALLVLNALLTATLIQALNHRFNHAHRASGG